MRLPQNKLVLPAVILAAGIALAPAISSAAISGTTSSSGNGSASCPSGYRASGGGFTMDSNSYSSTTSTEYFVTSSTLSSGTTWKATGYKITGSYSNSSGWTYHKYSYSPSVKVVCVK